MSSNFFEEGVTRNEEFLKNNQRKMEQNKDKKSPNQGKDPKMPKFNMGWLYMLILVGLIYVFMTDAGNSLTNSAVGGVRQEATYTKFKEYVEKQKEKKAHNKYFDSINRSYKKSFNEYLQRMRRMS